MAESQTYARTFIREWREAKGLSLDDLAAAIPMDKGNLSKMERGLLPYKQDHLERISTVLNLSIATLLVRSPSEPTPIWEYIDRASPDVRRMIEASAEAIYKQQHGRKK